MAECQLPTGTVTFLFTDIEGSTKRWERDRRPMGAALARHDALLRAGIEAHGGAVFKTVGDAFCAAFAAAPDAVAAAVAVQRELDGADWDASEPLRVRLALHAGRAEERDGDYFGPPVNRVARLLATGHGGQVLLSLAAAELARDELPEGTALLDLGEHLLKDLGRPERIFQVLHPDLPSEFPPLKTLDRQPHNLPAQPTPFLGREAAIAELAELLQRDGVRLVTLTGPGGTGKTRMALQIAADTVDTFPDGVWFVDLAPLADPALVPAAIAATIGLREQGGRPPLALLADHLRDRCLLLVLDNVEQVLAAAPVVGELLATAPGLTVLATSRAPLRLRAEREVPVPPLALPARGQPLPPERLTQYEAVRLFVERAVAIMPNFAVTNENAPAVAEICHRLDGLPLAIELAAARSRVLSPPALLARLEKRLSVLTGGARDLPTRQRTLRDAIAWSFDLLDPAEQMLFRRLAVFAGGCSLEAVEAVCDPAGDGGTFEGLAALAEASLVRSADGPADEPRYAMLETIREFGLERLEASSEAEDARGRHVAYFLNLAERADPELLGADQVAWLERLEAEHDNLRAALGWAVERDPGLAVRLAGGLGRFWSVRGHIREGRAWLERVLVAGEAALPAARARALFSAGALAHDQNDDRQATRLHEESLALYRRLGDDRGVATTLRNLAIIASERGDAARAEALLNESLALLHGLGDRWGVAATLHSLGIAAHDRGQRARAAALYAESQSLARQFGDTRGVVISLNNLGLLAREEGDQRRAAVLSQESLVFARALGDKIAIASLLENLADSANERQELGQAAALLAEGLGLYRQIDDRLGIAACLEGLGKTGSLAHQAPRSARLYGAAEAIREAICQPIQSSYRANYDRECADVRSQLDDDAFATAWAAGRALTLKEAVAEALALADDLAATTTPNAAN